MVKSFKKIFVCSKCDSQFPKWQGRCQECGNWGTITEQTVARKLNEEKVVPVAKTIAFREIKSGKVFRFETGIKEFDRVLGGGLPLSAVVLLGGDPGIGKSTLVLAVASSLSQENSVIYISGEESPEQIKQRIERMNLEAKNLHFLSETNTEVVAATLKENKPKVAIIDSIQTLFSEEAESEAGSIQQIKVATVKLVEVAKKQNITIIVIGHVTKEGTVAGPRTLEHLVDTVLYLEGDRYQSFRILRANKNRYGSTNEIGVFEMKEEGLKEVLNPSEAFLRDRQEKTPGSVITCIIEGNRPLLIEVQALVTKSGFGYPQRKAAGFDYKRFQLLIAVLTKRLRLKLFDQDVHVNVVGGVTIKEPAADLAVCLAIISALKNIPLPKNLVVLGEVGLGGEVRSVIQMEKRLEEASKLGFDKIIIPSGPWDRKVGETPASRFYKVKDIKEASEIAFSR